MVAGSSSEDPFRHGEWLATHEQRAELTRGSASWVNSMGAAVAAVEESPGLLPHGKGPWGHTDAGGGGGGEGQFHLQFEAMCPWAAAGSFSS